MNRFFVLMNTQRGDAATPLLLDNTCGAAMQFFATEDLAAEAARKTFFGQHFGFVVFDIADGTPYVAD